MQSGLHSGCLLRFSIGEGGLVLMDGKLEKADLHYLGKANRARASADSFSKVVREYFSKALKFFTFCNFSFQLMTNILLLMDCKNVGNATMLMETILREYNLLNYQLSCPKIYLTSIDRFWHWICLQKIKKWHQIDLYCDVR